MESWEAVIFRASCFENTSVLVIYYSYWVPTLTEITESYLNISACFSNFIYFALSLHFAHFPSSLNAS
jgi:hypothetical protein